MSAVRERLRALASWMRRHHGWGVLTTSLLWAVLRRGLPARVKHQWLLKIFVYLLYGVEAFHLSSTHDFLRNQLEDGESAVTDLIHSLKTGHPVHTLRVECYHWETNVEYYNTTNADGEQVTESRTHVEKVVTFRTTQEVPPDSYYSMDVSEERMHSTTVFSPVLQALRSYLTILGLRTYTHFRSVHIADRETEDHFSALVNALTLEHAHRDDLISCQGSWDIPGLKTCVFGRMEGHQQPGLGDRLTGVLLSTRCYRVLSALALSLPFRLLFDLMSQSQLVNISKRVSLTEYSTEHKRARVERLANETIAYVPLDLPKDVLKMIYEYLPPGPEVLEHSIKRSTNSAIAW